MIGFNNGKYQLLEEISIPVTSLSINRGYGAFEFLEVINRKPFYGDRHAARLLNTMKILKLNTDFDRKIEEIVEEIVERNGLIDYFIKLFVLPHEPARQGNYHGALYVFPAIMKSYDPSLYSSGAHLVTKEFERFLPKAKSTNYLAGQYWLDEQTDPQLTDVLFHNGQTVQETSRGNVFVVKDGKVTTPAQNILNGVTRGIILEILGSKNIPFAEAEVSLEELFSADEVFLSSTTKHIMPITRIDEHIIGKGTAGEITWKIMLAFQRLRESAGK